MCITRVRRGHKVTQLNIRWVPRGSQEAPKRTPRTPRVRKVAQLRLQWVPRSSRGPPGRPQKTPKKVRQPQNTFFSPRGSFEGPIGPLSGPLKVPLRALKALNRYQKTRTRLFGGKKSPCGNEQSRTELGIPRFGTLLGPFGLYKALWAHIRPIWALFGSIPTLLWALKGPMGPKIGLLGL